MTPLARAVRSQEVNNVDETSWRKNGALRWLWIMGNTVAAYFMVHGSRSKTAFSSLIRDWQGILVSDGYNVYQKWVGKRQACLAHLIRTAKVLSERKDREISRFGAWATEELRRLCKMANAPPTKGEWGMFYARFIRLITRHRDREDDAGQFARRLEREVAHLWVFIEEGKAVPAHEQSRRTSASLRRAMAQIQFRFRKPESSPRRSWAMIFKLFAYTSLKPA